MITALLLVVATSQLPLQVVEPIDTSTTSREELQRLVVSYRTSAIVWRTNAQIERDERLRDVAAKVEAFRTVTTQQKLIRAMEARQETCRVTASSLPGWIGIAIGVAGAVVTAIVLTTAH